MSGCEFCDEPAPDIEEYCHRCGAEPVCFDCLDDEWCPDCNQSHWDGLPDHIKRESIKMAKS